MRPAWINMRVVDTSVSFNFRVRAEYEVDRASGTRLVTPLLEQIGTNPTSPFLSSRPKRAALFVALLPAPRLVCLT
jgi:hypothetical protein